MKLENKVSSFINAQPRSGKLKNWNEGSSWSVNPEMPHAESLNEYSVDVKFRDWVAPLFSDLGCISDILSEKPVEAFYFK